MRSLSFLISRENEILFVMSAGGVSAVRLRFIPSSTSLLGLGMLLSSAKTLEGSIQTFDGWMACCSGVRSSIKRNADSFWLRMESISAGLACTLSIQSGLRI